MRKPNETLLPLALLSLAGVALLATAPACMEAPDSYDESLEPRSIKEVDLDMCPDLEEIYEGDLEEILATNHFICGLVLDSEGNMIEEGVEIRIDGKLVTNDPKIDWRRKKNKEQPAVQVDISAPGYAPLVTVVSGSVFNQPFVLQKLNEKELDWGEGGMITDASGSLVEIPPESLLTKEGEKPEGNIRFGTFFYNPALQQLPGDYSAINSQDQPVYLQSYGTLYMAARDEAGNQLVLAPGASVQVTMPLDERLVEKAPKTTPLWSFDRERGLWVQIEGKGVVFEAGSLELGHGLGQDGHPTEIQAPNTNVFDIWDCSSFGTGDPCFPEHCKYNSTTGTTGEFGTLGFVNFDIEKTEPGCIYVDIDEGALSPEDFPVCLQFEVAGPAGPIVREECMGPDGTVLYNIPAFSDVEVELLYTYGCPSGMGSQVVNSGAPWGGVGAPSNPAGDCNGSITLPPF